MWRGHMLKAGPNSGRRVQARPYLVFTRRDTDTLSERTGFGSKVLYAPPTCHMVSSRNLPTLLKGHRLTCCLCYFFLSISLFWTSLEDLSAWQMDSVSTWTSGCKGTPSFLLTPRHMDNTAMWGSFPLKVQNPLLVKFCFHCPVSFP